MSEWRETTLGEIGSLFDGPHATPTRRDEGPYFLNISSLKSGRLDLSESDHVSEEDFARWTKRVVPREGDLLFSYETRLGDAALMPAGVRACLGRRMALLRPDRASVDPRFLLYLYLAPTFQSMIGQNAIHGATVNRIPLNSMASWPVSVPVLSEQCAIADVLGALDDKIAANTKLAIVSGELARSHSRQLARSAQSQALLGDVAMLAYGKALPASKRLAGSIPVYGSGGIGGFHNEALVAGPGVIVGRKGSVGATYWSGGDFFPIDTTFYVVPKRDVPLSYLYFMIESQRFGEFNSDSAVPGLNRDQAYRSKIAVPDVEKLSAFDACAQELLRVVVGAERENEILAATRNALLPALMAGQLTVRQAERIAEDPTADEHLVQDDVPESEVGSPVPTPNSSAPGADAKLW